MRKMKTKRKKHYLAAAMLAMLAVATCIVTLTCNNYLGSSCILVIRICLLLSSRSGSADPHPASYI